MILPSINEISHPSQCQILIVDSYNAAGEHLPSTVPLHSPNLCRRIISLGKTFGPFSLTSYKGF